MLGQIEIRVYQQLGYIEIAGEVAIKYVQAVMGKGVEYFVLEETLGSGYGRADHDQQAGMGALDCPGKTRSRAQGEQRPRGGHEHSGEAAGGSRGLPPEGGGCVQAND